MTAEKGAGRNRGVENVAAFTHEDAVKKRATLHETAGEDGVVALDGRATSDRGFGHGHVISEGVVMEDSRVHEVM